MDEDTFEEILERCHKHLTATELEEMTSYQRFQCWKHQQRAGDETFEPLPLIQVVRDYEN